MEFIIDYIATGESGRHTLIGRCGDAPIRVGDEFQLAYHYEQLDVAGSAPRRMDEKDVTVYVNEIQAYGHKLDALGQGMTGSVVVSGVGIEKLAPGMILGGEAMSARQPASASAQDRK